MNEGDKISDFTIQRLISNKGGFADVYEAICDKDDSSVALKVLRPTKDALTLYLFKNECDVLSAVLVDENPGIVKIKASENDGDTHLLAMEKLTADAPPGTDLADDGLSSIRSLHDPPR